MDTVLVIMKKNNKTGLFEKELMTLNIQQNDDYILNIYAMDNEAQSLNIHIKLTTKSDVLDWEYNAIYDYYDTTIYQNIAEDIIEKDEEYNPTWEIILKNEYNDTELQKIINNILNLHKCELDEVFSTISDKKGDYENEE